MKKQTKTILFTLFLIILLSALFAVMYFVLQVDMFDRSGWHKTEDGETQYLDYYGKPLTQWQTIDNTRYYFSDDGNLVTGWADTEDGRYYFDDSGLIMTGWVDTDEGRYYLNPDGRVNTNWLKTEKGWYYLVEGSSFHTGWLDLDGKKYFFDDEGIMQTGWVKNSVGRYYLQEDGTAATGFLEIDGITRYFTETGEYIVLLNRWNAMPEDFTPELVELQGFYVDITCRDNLEQMMADCNAAGHYCVLNSTYRDISFQQQLWDNRYNNYINNGKSKEEATELTWQVVAFPGTSEHHSGLAVDITGTDEMYQWLADHSWEYGFILRYAEDKTEQTGIIYEPWHFRYVGKEMAEDIYNSSLCLEEYLEMLKKA